MNKTLHDTLWDLNNEYLSFRVKLLEVKAKSQRKADMIEAITNSLSGIRVASVWNALNQQEQQAVLETAYSDDLIYAPQRIQAKYGSAPPFHKKLKGDPKTHYERLNDTPTKLNLFLYPSPKYNHNHILPEDLATQIRAMVKRPAPFRIPTLEKPNPEDGLFTRMTENEALSEIIALLRLTEQGELRISEKTAIPSVVGTKKILRHLTGGDYYPPDIAYKKDKKSYGQEIGAIKPVAWARLLKNSRYIEKLGTKSKLTPAGIKALSLPPHQIIKSLWTRWLPNTTFDEFNRISEIKGQKSKGHMTAKPPRRSKIVGALEGCPVDRWISINHFSSYMLAQGLEFEVSKNLWKLYLCDSQYGSLGYGGSGDWDTVQLRYIFAFIFEYAATLGIIDIAYVHPKGACNNYQDQWGADDLEWLSRYDGLRAIRLTKLGAYCLGINDHFKSTQPDTSLQLEILPNLGIRILSGIPTPAEKILLETWSEAVDENSWRLEPQRSRDAVERGQNPQDFIKFLQQCDEQPLPETVEGFFKNCEHDGKALKNLGEAQMFQCRDAETANIICAQKTLAKHCFKVNETQLVVYATHLLQFRKRVKSLGLGIV